MAFSIPVTTPATGAVLALEDTFTVVTTLTLVALNEYTLRVEADASYLLADRAGSLELVSADYGALATVGQEANTLATDGIFEWYWPGDGAVADGDYPVSLTFRLKKPMYFSTTQDAITDSVIAIQPIWFGQSAGGSESGTAVVNLTVTNGEIAYTYRCGC